MNLTPVPAKEVKAPLLDEAPINVECKVTQIVELGTHDMFLAEVVAVHADDKYLDEETGSFDLSKAKPIAYSHGFYYELGKRLGKFGWSVEKKKTKRKRIQKK